MRSEEGRISLGNWISTMCLTRAGEILQDGGMSTRSSGLCPMGVRFPVGDAADLAVGPLPMLFSP